MPRVTAVDACRRFLHFVWSRSPHPAAHAFLTHKNWETGEWNELSPHDFADDPDDITVPTVHDLYFAPTLFSIPRRLRKAALPSRWLFADLDEVDPNGLPAPLCPTLAWETSPGRYQALWLLDRPLSPRRLEALNQQLTYATGADRGGWSLTKVLRVPGSTSTKYGTPFPVTLLPRDPNEPPVIHHGPTLARYLEQHGPAIDQDGIPTDADLPPVPPDDELPDADELYARRRRRIPVRARQLLNTQTVLSTDDRSARLWELETLLLHEGRLSIADTYTLVRASPWNKYRGQRRERRALLTELHKAYTAGPTRPPQPKPTQPHPSSPSKPSRPKSPAKVEFTMLRDFLTRPLPRPSWLVEGIWSSEAHGILAGESKGLKSLLTLDLAVSIASGTPFLGTFPVPRVGPVFVIQEENTPNDMHDRLMRIATSRGLGPSVTTSRSAASTILDMGADLPVYLLSNEGFALNDEEWMRWLERRIRQHRPALVVLDPLYLMVKGIDENSAVEMTPILARLLQLKQKYACGILIVHHYHKPREHDQAPRRGAKRAHRISGTGVFHRWLASAIYVERPDETVPSIILSGEHRSHGANGAFAIDFNLGTDDDLVYSATVSPIEVKRPDDEAEDTPPEEREFNLPKRPRRRRPTAEDPSTTSR